jgi:hypothetical protein
MIPRQLRMNISSMLTCAQGTSGASSNQASVRHNDSHVCWMGRATTLLGYLDIVRGVYEVDVSLFCRPFVCAGVGHGELELELGGLVVFASVLLGWRWMLGMMRKRKTKTNGVGGFYSGVRRCRVFCSSS